MLHRSTVSLTVAQFLTAVLEPREQVGNVYCHTVSTALSICGDDKAARIFITVKFDRIAFGIFTNAGKCGDNHLKRIRPAK